MPGWDGLLEVGRGNAWAPTGVSGWEMSCEQSVTNKANTVYKNRTEEPLGLDKATTTFVFVTSRRWSSKRQWEQTRRNDGHWFNVRALDADDLVIWLEQSPEVTQWFAGTIGKLPFEHEATLRIEERQVETNESLTSGFSEMRVKFEAIMASLDDQTEKLDSVLEESSAQQNLSDDIDAARELLRQGLVVAARTRLQQIQMESEELTDDVSFRLTHNLAICALSDENTDEACTLLEESYSIQPGSSAGIANAALAARLRGNPERAKELAQKALALEQQSASAAANLMWTLWETCEIDELEEFVRTENWILEESTPALTLAGIRVEQGRYEEAISIYRCLISIDEENAHAHLGLGHCLLTYAQVHRVPAGFDGEALAKCQTAESEASRAVDLFQSTQLNGRRSEALVLRSGTRAFLGRVDAALRDVDAVLGENPRHVAAILHKGLILLQKGMPGEARIWLERVDDPELRDQLLLPLADACVDSGDAGAAVDLLKGNFQLNPPSWEDVGRAGTFLRAEAAMGCDDSVGRLLESALNKHSSDPGLLILTAIHSDLQGDKESAEASLVRAADLANDPHRQAIRLQLGKLYSNMGRYAEAAEQYRLSSAGETSHPAAIPLLLSLFNSKQYGKALDLARRIRRSSEGVDTVVIEVEAEILGHIGDVDAALARYVELCAHADSTPDDRVKLALLQFRSGNRDVALETVVSVDVAKLIHDPKTLMKLAYLKRFLGASDYLEDAYLATRHGRNDADIQLGYFRMFLGCGDDEPEPLSVKPGTAVQLRRDEYEEWWQILENAQESPGERELSPDDPLTERLLNHCVGDTIVLREGLENLSYEITGLQSKYVYAFQDIYENFSTRFPDNMALSRVEFDPDFTKFFESIDLRHQRVRNVEELYRAGRVPFASFCFLIGLSVLETWPEYTLQPDAQIRFAHGSEEEDSAARNALRDCECIVLDFMALLTVHELRLEGSLRKRFSRILVPQTVYDEVQEVVYARRVDAAPRAVVGKDDSGQYTHTEIDRQTWLERQSFFEAVLRFCDSLERIPCYPQLVVDEAQEYVDVLTSSGAGAVFAGGSVDDRRLVLISDDLVQANLARRIRGCAANSQSLLLELLRSKYLAEEEYSSSVEKLATRNYWFVRVRAADILQSLEANAYSVQAGTLALLGTLGGPECSAETSASVAAEVVASLATMTMMRERLESILFTILQCISRGRESNEVLWLFKTDIASRLRLAPIQCERVLRAVDLYVHSLRL